VTAVRNLIKLIEKCGTYWESKNWLFSDLSRWTIYHSYIFISPNLSDCCQVSKQAEIWPVQAEIIDHLVPRVSMFGPTELRWRPTKLKNMVLALTSALNRGCAPARPNKVRTVGLHHVINALKISRFSAYHLCSTNTYQQTVLQTKSFGLIWIRFDSVWGSVRSEPNPNRKVWIYPKPFHSLFEKYDEEMNSKFILRSTEFEIEEARRPVKFEMRERRLCEDCGTNISILVLRQNFQTKSEARCGWANVL
jgi:hypothetical protein